MTSKRHQFGVGVLNSNNFHSIRSTIVVATTRVYHKGLQLLLQHLKLIAAPIESSRNRLTTLEVGWSFGMPNPQSTPLSILRFSTVPFNWNHNFEVFGNP